MWWKIFTTLSGSNFPLLHLMHSLKKGSMLATILKSERATQTTIAIIEAFAKLRELPRTIG